MRWSLQLIGCGPASRHIRGNPYTSQGQGIVRIIKCESVDLWRRTAMNARQFSFCTLYVEISPCIAVQTPCHIEGMTLLIGDRRAIRGTTTPLYDNGTILPKRVKLNERPQLSFPLCYKNYYVLPRCRVAIVSLKSLFWILVLLGHRPGKQR